MSLCDSGKAIMVCYSVDDRLYLVVSRPCQRTAVGAETSSLCCGCLSSVACTVVVESVLTLRRCQSLNTLSLSDLIDREVASSFQLLMR